MEILIPPVEIELIVNNDACDPKCNAKCDNNCRRDCGLDFCGKF